MHAVRLRETIAGVDDDDIEGGNRGIDNNILYEKTMMSHIDKQKSGCAYLAGDLGANWDDI